MPDENPYQAPQHRPVYAPIPWAKIGFGLIATIFWLLIGGAVSVGLILLRRLLP